MYVLNLIKRTTRQTCQSSFKWWGSEPLIGLEVQVGNSQVREKIKFKCQFSATRPVHKKYK